MAKGLNRRRPHDSNATLKESRSPKNYNTPVAGRRPARATSLLNSSGKENELNVTFKYIFKKGFTHKKLVLTETGKISGGRSTL